MTNTVSFVNHCIIILSVSRILSVSYQFKKMAFPVFVTIFFITRIFLNLEICLSLKTNKCMNSRLNMIY